MDLGIDRFWLAVIAVAAISVALVVGWRSYGDEFGAHVFRVLLAERTSPIPTLDVPKRTSSCRPRRRGASATPSAAMISPPPARSPPTRWRRAG